MMQNMNLPMVQQNTPSVQNPMMGQQSPNHMALLQQQYAATMNNQFGVQQNQGNMSLVNKLFQEDSNQFNVPSGGTSIADLKKMQPLPNKDKSTVQPPQQQQQQRQLKNNKQYTQDYEIRQQDTDPSDSDQERDKIKYLVKDINKSLDDYGPSKMKNTEDSDDDFYTEKEEDVEKIKKTEEYNYMMEYIKEPLLIVIIYVILSQAFVRKSVGNYIQLINPSEDGNVSFLGYVIYGALLALVFMFFKKILVK